VAAFALFPDSADRCGSFGVLFVKVAPAFFAAGEDMTSFPAPTPAPALATEPEAAVVLTLIAELAPAADVAGFEDDDDDVKMLLEDDFVL
jgi:hypothetical protein